VLASRRRSAGRRGPGRGGREPHHVQLRTELPAPQGGDLALRAGAPIAGRGASATVRHADGGLHRRWRTGRLGAARHHAPAPGGRRRGPRRAVDDDLPADLRLRPHRRAGFPSLRRGVRGSRDDRSPPGGAAAGGGALRGRRALLAGARPRAAARQLGGWRTAEGAHAGLRPQAHRQVLVEHRFVPGGQGRVRGDAARPARRA